MHLLDIVCKSQSNHPHSRVASNQVKFCARASHLRQNSAGPTFLWGDRQIATSVDLSVVLSFTLCFCIPGVSKMRVQSLLRAQSLATSSLRCSARTAARAPSKCALSTVAASRTPYTNGTKTDAWIGSQKTYGQRRWQSAAAQVYVLSCIQA